MPSDDVRKQYTAPKVGQAWCGRVRCFKGRPLECTMLGGWDEPHTNPWLIVTDLAPEQTKVCWYSMRFWIERGFKQNKRGGWQWQNTRQTAPVRAERMWLAMAVATLWVVSVGGEAELELSASSLDELPESHIARRSVKTHGRSKPRILGVFRRGLIVLLMSFYQGERKRIGRFVPEAWPDGHQWEWINLETDTPPVTASLG
ncbi:MAG: hypothetical protein WCS37_22645 [Chloroflexota bacterium]|nr:hypothetical protein [Chloroflexota bacterium]